MSENKELNELEFDDEIDFEGLDDFSEEEADDSFGENDEIVYEDIGEIRDDESENESDDNEFELSDESFESGDLKEKLSDEPLQEIDVSYNDSSENEKNNISANRFIVVNTVVSVLTFCAVTAGIIIGNNYIKSVESELEIKSQELAELEKENIKLEEDYLSVMNEVTPEDSGDFAEELTEAENGKIIFYDTSVGYSWTPVLEGIKLNEYKKEGFSIDDRGRVSYSDGEDNSSYFGIDVSSYQGEIDWQLVKEDDVEFAFLRIGYRGYGEEGKLCPDESFIDNYAAAHDAGIDLGVYFFSQAVSVDEAVQEANYVLELLEGRNLEYPIVFDWETVQTGDPEDIPRTEDVMPKTLTLSAIAFCETIHDAGYDAMIYTNKKLATIKYDLRLLQEYPIWLAYYDTKLDYRYDFDIWQYGTGQVDGIEGEVDVNIAMIK